MIKRKYLVFYECVIRLSQLRQYVSNNKILSMIQEKLPVQFQHQDIISPYTLPILQKQLDFLLMFGYVVTARLLAALSTLYIIG